MQFSVIMLVKQSIAMSSDDHQKRIKTHLFVFPIVFEIAVKRIWLRH
jgi:hypothetical protein